MHTDIHGYLFACIHTCMHTLIQGLAHEWIHTLCMDTCTHEYILASLHGYILALMHTYLHRPTYLATYKMTCRKLGMNSIESAQILVLCHIVPRIRRLYNVHRFEARSVCSICYEVKKHETSLSSFQCQSKQTKLKN